MIDLRLGDCLEVLRTMADNSVDSVVCDPPYGLNFMNKHWDYDIPSVEIWAECLRVLKPGGHLLAFAGTRTQHRMACRIEDAGFEIVDMAVWAYAQGMPKHKSRLKPAIEPITMARKPAKIATPLNIDACRVEGRERTDYGLSNSKRSQGVTFGKPSESADFDASKGRYPSNLIHDGSDEVVALFPDSAGCGGSVPRVKITGYGDGVVGTGESQYIGGERIPFDSGSGSAARFFYCAKANKKDRNEGLRGFDVIIHSSQSNESGLWDQEEKLARLLVDMDNSRLKVIDASGVLNKSVTEWNTLLFGRESTGSSRQDTTFTTKTETNSTIESRILSCFQNLLTSVDTAAANFETVLGGSRVESVEHGTQQITITSARTGSAPGAENAPLKTRLRISVSARRNNHVTVKPTDLMAYLCRLVTPPGGVVLDPFMGSGSTGKAAVKEGFRFIGIEMMEEYFAIAHERITGQPYFEDLI